MGGKVQKRGREALPAADAPENPSKRRRQATADSLKLSKLYDDLAAESDEVRLGAAKQLIVQFSPESNPAAPEVEKAIHRLISGLCSQRKAARVGFCVTLTELLRQLFGQQNASIPGLDLDVKSIVKLVEGKTKVEGNVPGQLRRDHLIGRLFGYKAVLQSSILVEPTLSLECWNELLDHVYGMARDIPWLREECGLILVEAVKSLNASPELEECAQGLVDRLGSFKLVNTPEGVAIWLTVKAHYEHILPENVWNLKDPLSKKERSRLAKVLREDFRDTSDAGKDAAVKSAAANPNPIFAWDIALSAILLRDTSRSGDQEPSKPEFPQFWVDVVDSNLFASSSSHERKSWGFKLFANLITNIPAWAIPSLFSPNFMRTLINQSKKEDRFLHAAALTALRAIQNKVEQDPTSAIDIFSALTSKNGTIDLDKITKTKTLEQILLAADDEALRKIVRHLHSLVLRPESQEQSVADARRQTIADMLLSTIRQYKQYDSRASELVKKDNWLRNALEIMIENAYFIPSKSARTSKVPLPPVSDANRSMFQERLSSCLSRLLAVETGSRSSFALMALHMIQSKASSSRNLQLLFKADGEVRDTLETALQTLDAIVTEGSIAGNPSAAEGFILLYSLTLLQVYNGDEDAILMLDDLDSSRNAISKSSKETTAKGSDSFVEIILSLLGNPRTLFRKIAEEVFTIFVSDISSDGLQPLTDVLDTEENLEGQRELFAQGDDDAEGADSDDGSNEASDVEMVDGKSEGSNESSAESSDVESNESNSDTDDSGTEDEDEELTQFNHKLALTLQTSKLAMNGEASDDSSDESDMDDEQMMALDPHLANIFKQRSQVTSKKKEREDAKQTVVQFKSRVLDLISIYMDKQYSNPLTLQVLLPVLRRTRANANKLLAEKSSKLLKAYFDTRTKRKGPLPKPDNMDKAWAILEEIHQEAKLGGGSNLHATSCSNASLHVVKVLVGTDRDNYGRVVDVYGKSQKEWFMDKKSPIQPVLFTQFQNWSMTVQKQGKQPALTLAR